MYRHLYGLKLKPFQNSADPAFLWMGRKHRDALSFLIYGVRNNKGCLLLTGGVGTGKTTLTRTLLGQLDKTVSVATIHDPGLAPLAFFNFIATAYGIQQRYRNKVDFLFDFESYLQKNRAAGRKALLIVDEAQRLDQVLLEEIRLLSNIEYAGDKLLNVIFVGHEAFLDVIASPENRALKQRITLNYHLETLTYEETRQMVRHRLKVAGATREIFTPEVFPGIFDFSLGTPRRIVVLCDLALLTGFINNVDTIGADIIAECAQDLLLPGETAREAARDVAAARETNLVTSAGATGRLPQPVLPPAKRKVWPWAAALLLAVGLGALRYMDWRPPPQTRSVVRMASLTGEVASQPDTVAVIEDESPVSGANPASPPAVTAVSDTLHDQRLIGHEEPSPFTAHGIAGTEQADTIKTTENRPPGANPATAPRERTGGSDRVQPRTPTPASEAKQAPRARPAAPSAVPPSKKTTSGTLAAQNTPHAPPKAVTGRAADAPPGSETPAPLPLAALSRPAATPVTAPIQNSQRPDNLAAPATDTTADPSSSPISTEDRIRKFVNAYCRAYESRDLERFRLFFTEDALEKGRPFTAVLPVYEKNFDALTALAYRIELTAWTEDAAAGQITLNGRFDIRYHLPEKDWRTARGEIRMDLVETGGVFRVKRLDYEKD